MLTLKTLAKGQVVIPAELRRKFGIEPGSLIEIRAAADHLELYPLPRDPIAAFRGSIKKGPSLAKKLIAEHRVEVKRDAKR
jgi:AbrB family looped-hinge helix DNA binding protein